MAMWQSRAEQSWAGQGRAEQGRGSTFTKTIVTVVFDTGDETRLGSHDHGGTLPSTLQLQNSLYWDGCCLTTRHGRLDCCGPGPGWLRVAPAGPGFSGSQQSARRGMTSRDAL